MEMSRRFNFDDFDEQIKEALDINDEVFGRLAASGVERVLRPGEIGAVIAEPTFVVDIT